MKFRKRRRQNNREFFDKTLISLSDLGLRVMIAFLFSISIFHEEGLKVKLPPYIDDYSSYCMKKRNMLRLYINDKNELYVRDQQISKSELKNHVKAFIINYGKDENLSESPKNAIVALQNDRGTTYDVYFKVYQEIKKAYREVWDDYAQQYFNSKYKALNNEQRIEVLSEIPYVVSEVEPVELYYKKL